MWNPILYELQLSLDCVPFPRCEAPCYRMTRCMMQSANPTRRLEQMQEPENLPQRALQEDHNSVTKRRRIIGVYCYVPSDHGYRYPFSK